MNFNQKIVTEHIGNMKQVIVIGRLIFERC